MINDYDLCLIIYLINHSLVPNANSIDLFRTAKFSVVWWKGIISKGFNRFDYWWNMLWVDVP